MHEIGRSRCVYRALDAIDKLSINSLTFLRASMTCSCRRRCTLAAASRSAAETRRQVFAASSAPTSSSLMWHQVVPCSDTVQECIFPPGVARPRSTRHRLRIARRRPAVGGPRPVCGWPRHQRRATSPLVCCGPRPVAHATTWCVLVEPLHWFGVARSSTTRQPCPRPVRENLLQSRDEPADDEPDHHTAGGADHAQARLPSDKAALTEAPSAIR